MITDNKAVQVLRAELLRPMRVHLKSGRSFGVMRADAILGSTDGFIVSRPRPNGPFPAYVETVGPAEVAEFELKLKWWLPVARKNPLARLSQRQGISVPSAKRQPNTKSGGQLHPKTEVKALPPGKGIPSGVRRQYQYKLN